MRDENQQDHEVCMCVQHHALTHTSTHAQEERGYCRTRTVLKIRALLPYSVSPHLLAGRVLWCVLCCLSFFSRTHSVVPVVSP